ncbi:MULTISPECIES: hypothetical protein [Corynebacterium]|uniref:hypothetical protein n=1 Tax=Corynebacterium TaxID=1716 RepID=UPI001959D8CE|nr:MULTISPECIES: hypothetical protein [Corynebacterium]QRQ64412.1 hypothetical protein I6J23_07340 [Corynebacterium kroppenstedtii]
MNQKSASATWASGWGALETRDPREAARIIAGEAALPFIPQLINRGVGSSLSGSTLSLLSSSYVQGPRSWQMSGPTVASRRRNDEIHRDIDVYEEAWEGGSALSSRELKVQVMGPWSLAVATELSDGHRIVSESSAVRGFHDEWSGGVADYLSELHRRFGKRIVLHIGEPYVDTLAQGRIAGTTDWDIIPPVHNDVLNAEWDRSISGVLDELGRVTIGDASQGAVDDVVMSCRASLPGNLEIPAWALPLIGLEEMEHATANGSSTHRMLDRVGERIDADGRAIVIGVAGDHGVVDDGTEVMPGSIAGGGDDVGDRDQAAVTTAYASEDPARDRAVRIARVWKAMGLDPTLMGERVNIVEGHGRRGREQSTAQSLRLADDVRDMLRRDSGDL